MFNWLKPTEMSQKQSLTEVRLSQLMHLLGLSEDEMSVLDQKKWNETIAAKVFDNIIKKCVAPNHHTVFWGDRLLSLDKSMGFLSEPHFHAAFQTIYGSHEYDQYQSPHTIAWRLHTLVWAAQIGMQLEGDFVECGVFKGDMAWFVANTVDFFSKQKQFYLYDTFAGFDAAYSSSADFPEHPGFIELANHHYQDPTLYQSVCDRFSDQSMVHVIKGTVPDVLHERAPEKIAFLHIDLNSPAAEIGALEILFPRLSPGAVVVFDDYGWKLFHRQKEVEDEFMRQRGYHILELPTGQGLVVKRA